MSRQVYLSNLYVWFCFLYCCLWLIFSISYAIWLSPPKSKDNDPCVHPSNFCPQHNSNNVQKTPLTLHKMIKKKKKKKKKNVEKKRDVSEP